MKTKNQAVNNQSVNRAKRAASIKSQILDRDDEVLDTQEIERYIGRSLREIEVEKSFASDDGVIAQLFDKVG